MKKVNILRSFNSRKFKYGGYAAMITAIVLAVLVAVNLVADMIPLKVDLTSNKLYSLSEQTIDILKNLDDEITIYTVGERGKTSSVVQETIDRYKETSNKITVDNIDPVRDPLKAQKYTKDDTQLSTGSVVVERGDVFRVIDQYDMYNFTQSSSGWQVESVAVEQRLTSAIMFVSGAEAPLAYTLEGHGEALLDSNTQKQMELENFETKSLNLLGLDAVPDDADLVIVNSPQRDLTKEEADVLRAYLENQGRAIFMLDLAGELPNFASVLKSYGVEMSNTLVLEGQQDRYIGGNPLYVLPDYAEHDITTPLKTAKMPLVMTITQAVNILEDKRNTITITPLLKTSNAAFARRTDSTVKTMEKDETDISGPFNLAVAIEDTVYKMAANETKVSRLVVIGNSTYLTTGLEGATNLFMNSLNWIFERKDSITIRPKSVASQPLKITELQFRIFAGISVLLIPLAVIAAGFVVWLRRRHL